MSPLQRYVLELHDYSNTGGYPRCIRGFLAVSFFCTFMLFLPTGCGLEQDPACDVYLKCLEHYNDVFERSATTLEDYEEGGDCWKNSQNAQLCRNHCIEATSELADALELANEDTGPCR